MKKNVKDIVVIVCFIAVIAGFMLANMFNGDEVFSFSERRKLAGIPEFTFEKLFSGDLFEEFEKYLLDQFILRDSFRSIKAIGVYYLFNQNDNNGIYIVDGNISKIEYPLNEKSILNATKKLNEVYRKHLKGMNVSYAIIPDKNYFLAAENGYLEMDYSKIQKIMTQQIKNMQYIDLFDSLTLDDYYKTDIHWSQDRIIKAANKILEELGTDTQINEGQYSKKELHPFYGSYYGQVAINVNPDKLVYLTNETIDGAVVYDYETKSYSNVYMPEKFKSIDSYDVYLSGSKALLTIENHKSSIERELILFRDSFGSSMAPLLLEEYAKITLVDLRYISTNLLGDFIEFSDNQDVLFLYSTQILNNSYMMK